MALFDTNCGLGGLLGNLGDFGIGVTSQTGGLIDDPAQRDAINKRALFSGGLNALLTYAATPKNLNTGSAIPYLSKAGLAGFNASQDVIDRALNSAYKSQLLKGRNDPFGQIDITKFTPESIKAFQDKLKGTADVAGVQDFSILKEKEPKKDKLNIGSVSPSDVTKKSLDIFKDTGNYNDLEFIKKPTEDNKLKIGSIDFDKFTLSSIEKFRKTGVPTDLERIPEKDKADKINKPTKLSNTDKETAMIILKEGGIKDPSTALSTVVASQTNKYMSEGFDQVTATNKAIDDLKRSGAIKNYQRNIDIPFFGKTKVPFSESTVFDINKSNVPNAPKKPLSSF
jgi:hypothetical protein